MTFVAWLVSGSAIERGTDGSAAWCKHGVAAADGVVDALVALDVALDDLDVVGERREVRAVPGREVVEDADVVADRAAAARRVGSR